MTINQQVIVGNEQGDNKLGLREGRSAEDGSFAWGVLATLVT
jgi:hypothetical protein